MKYKAALSWYCSVSSVGVDGGIGTGDTADSLIVRNKNSLEVSTEGFFLCLIVLSYNVDMQLTCHTGKSIFCKISIIKSVLATQG